MTLEVLAAARVGARTATLMLARDSERGGGVRVRGADGGEDVAGAVDERDDQVRVRTNC